MSPRRLRDFAARKRLSRAFATLACVLACVPGCGEEAPREPELAKERKAVGEVATTDARVGLVVDDTQGILFFCGGPTTTGTLTYWMRGARRADGSFAWSDEAGVANATGAPEGEGFRGTLVVGAEPPRAWAASPVLAGTRAGLYDAKLPEGRAGVVVFHDAAAADPSPQGAFRTLEARFLQILPVREASAIAGGFRVNVTFPAGPRVFDVTPVVLTR